MGKHEKAQAANVGRVPIVQGGKPLLYPRYRSVEELLQIGKSDKASKDENVEITGGGDRPNKKVKRDAAADGPCDGDKAEATPAGKGYGLVGEDGLTYKQRRQQRRAAERAVREAEAVAAGLAATAGAGPEGNGAAGGAAVGTRSKPATPADAAAASAALGPRDADGTVGAKDRTAMKKKKGEKGDKQGRDEEDVGTAAASTWSDMVTRGTADASGGVRLEGRGNADEAARIRAVLGFTSTGANGGGGGGGKGVLKLAALAGVSSTPGVAGVATAGGGGSGGGLGAEGSDAAPGDGGGDGVSARKKKAKGEEEKGKSATGKKRKKEQEGGDDSEGEEKGEGPRAQQQQDGAGGQKGLQRSAPAAARAGAGAVSNTTDGKTGAAPVVGSKPQQNGGGKQQKFSFDFQLQAEVEAETEARLARLMALDSTKDGFVPRRIWVSGLPHEFDEATVREYWGYCGEVEALHLLRFPDSGNFNGTAFITFKTQEAFEAALACNGEMLEGRPLRVEKCKAAAEIKGKARASGGSSQANDGGGGAKVVAGGGGGSGRVAGYPVAYCGNISFEAGVEDLQQLFSRAGVVPTKIRLHADKASGRSRGFAHVHFANDEDVDKAVALDGAPFHGRKIRVTHAQPKSEEV